VLGELDRLLAEVLDALPQFEAALVAPRVPLDTKYRILDRVLDGRVSVLFLHFLKVVTRRRRFDCIRAMQQAAHQLYNEYSGRVDVEVRTAVPLDDGQRQVIQRKLEAFLQCGVNLLPRTDPKLVGGLVVRVGDTLYDASVAGQLQHVREDVLEKMSQALRGSGSRFEIQETGKQASS
jgi:F-type H+-transporting ATPase subunit delta